MRFLYAVNKIDTESKPHVKFILNEIIGSYHIPTETASDITEAEKL